MQEIANIKCPECEHIQSIEIPEGKCLPFYVCEGCDKMIAAKTECCVICEYSDKKCPIKSKNLK